MLSALVIRDQVLPPTINLDSIGDGCRLDYVPNTAREATIDASRYPIALDLVAPTEP